MEENKNDTNFDTIKVSGKSDPNKVAGVIASKLKEEGKIKARTIGAGALNQIMKAVIIAKSLLIQSGIDINISPSFYSTEIDGQDITGIELRLTKSSN